MSCLAGCDAGCLKGNTDCIASFSYVGSIPDVSLCTMQTQGCFASCDAACGVGGANGGGRDVTLADVLTDEQLAMVQTCQDTLGVADADGDGLVGRDEYLTHVDLFASASCPGAARPTAYADEFDGLSCLLCAGVLDPTDPLARDAAGCPCLVDVDAPPGPIDLVASTAVEGFLYCGQVAEAAAISCAQPDRTCYDDCYADEGACQGGCAGDGPVLDCIVSCDGPFHRCLDGCAAADGNGGGVPPDAAATNGAGGAGAGGAVPGGPSQSDNQSQPGGDSGETSDGDIVPEMNGSASTANGNGGDTQQPPGGAVQPGKDAPGDAAPGGPSQSGGGGTSDGDVASETADGAAASARAGPRTHRVVVAALAAAAIVV